MFCQKLRETTANAIENAARTWSKRRWSRWRRPGRRTQQLEAVPAATTAPARAPRTVSSAVPASTTRCTTITASVQQPTATEELRASTCSASASSNGAWSATTATSYRRKSYGRQRSSWRARRSGRVRARAARQSLAPVGATECAERQQRHACHLRALSYVCYLWSSLCAV